MVGASTLYHEGRYVTVMGLRLYTCSVVGGNDVFFGRWRIFAPSLCGEVTPDPTDPTEQEPGPTGPTFRNQEAMREDSVYGERKDRRRVAAEAGIRLLNCVSVSRTRYCPRPVIRPNPF